MHACVCTLLSSIVPTSYVFALRTDLSTVTLVLFLLITVKYIYISRAVPLRDGVSRRFHSSLFSLARVSAFAEDRSTAHRPPPTALRTSDVTATCRCRRSRRAKYNSTLLIVLRELVSVDLLRCNIQQLRVSVTLVGRGAVFIWADGMIYGFDVSYSSPAMAMAMPMWVLACHAVHHAVSPGGEPHITA